MKDQNVNGDKNLQVGRDYIVNSKDSDKKDVVFDNVDVVIFWVFSLVGSFIFYKIGNEFNLSDAWRWILVAFGFILFGGIAIVARKIIRMLGSIIFLCLLTYGIFWVYKSYF